MLEILDCGLGKCLQYRTVFEKICLSLWAYAKQHIADQQWGWIDPDFIQWDTSGTSGIGMVLKEIDEIEIDCEARILSQTCLRRGRPAGKFSQLQTNIVKFFSLFWWEAECFAASGRSNAYRIRCHGARRAPNMSHQSIAACSLACRNIIIRESPLVTAYCMPCDNRCVYVVVKPKFGTEMASRLN